MLRDATGIVWGLTEEVVDCQLDARASHDAMSVLLYIACSQEYKTAQSRTYEKP